MKRPLADKRPIGPFAQLDQNIPSRGEMWVRHTVVVLKNDYEFERANPGTFIRAFGGLDNISDSADSLSIDSIQMGSGSIDPDTKVAVEYDIIPPADGKGVKLYYYIYEGHNQINDGETIELSTVTRNDMNEMGNFYADQVKEFYPDSQVKYSNSVVACEEPIIEDSEEVLYFTYN